MYCFRRKSLTFEPIVSGSTPKKRKNNNLKRKQSPLKSKNVKKSFFFKEKTILTFYITKQKHIKILKD